MQKHCPVCGGGTQRWGKTQKGTPRFFCLACKRTFVRERKDTLTRHRLKEMDSWLGGKDSLSEIAGRYRKTRQALWKEFHPFFGAVPEPEIPKDFKPRILILDGTYVHGHILCAMIAIDEHDNLFWKFAPYESSRIR